MPHFLIQGSYSAQGFSGLISSAVRLYVRESRASVARWSQFIIALVIMT